MAKKNIKQLHNYIIESAISKIAIILAKQQSLNLFIMIVVESYTKLIADAVNTHLPNSSFSAATTTTSTCSSISISNTPMTNNNDCIYIPLKSPSVISSSSIPNTISTLSTWTLSSSLSSSSSSSSSSDDRSRLLIILRYIIHQCQNVYHYYHIDKYLNDTIKLAVLPCFIGLMIGFAIGWYFCFYNCFIKSISDDDTDDTDDDEEEEEELEEEEKMKPKNNTNNKENIIIHKRQKQQHLPQHIAIIMDGNRRYGKQKYNSIYQGHYDGSRTLINVAKWCIEECIPMITVYAFSTENWNRSEKEITCLMNLFCANCEEIRKEAIKNDICVRVLSTESDKVKFF